MSGAFGPRRFAFSRPKLTTAAITLIALVVLLALPQWAPSPSGSRGPAVAGAASSYAAAQVAEAEASIALAAPPASSCAPSGGCGPGPSAPHPAASSHPVWSDLSSKMPYRPQPRYLATFVYDPVDQYVVLFGGSGSSGPMSDTWTYANGVWTDISPGSSPSARYAAFAAWDYADGYLVLFGGYDSSTGTLLNDTWTFVGGSWTSLSPTTAPAPRWRGAMAYDPTDHYVVLYGGDTGTAGTSIKSDTWEFKAGSWTDVTSSVTGKPGGIMRQEAATDFADGYVVMFGGCTSEACSPTLTTTWTYENLTWTKEAPTTSPGGRAYTGIAWDGAINAVVMFGGENYASTTGYADTWTYSAGNWTSLTSSLTTAPSSRAFEGLSYDALDGYEVLFGGQNPALTTTWLNDTWAFGPSVIANFAATPSAIDLGQAVTFNATPFAYNGYVIVSYTGLPPGCTSQNVTVLVCTPTATGRYLVNVSENDSLGSPAIKNATVTIAADPQITAYTSSLAVVTAGTPLWFNVSVVGGSPGYVYGWSGLPPGCASANVASLACTPGATANGRYTVGVNVGDAAGFHVFSNVSVAVNAKPSVTSFVPSRATIDLGQSVVLYANTSGGTAPFTYAYSGLPSGCASANTAALSCTPSAQGAFLPNVTVTDTFGWAASASTSVQVNADPTITTFAASPAAFDIGHATTFYMNATGGTGLLTYSYTGMPAGCNLGAAAGGVCTPTQPGNYTVTGVAIDSLGFRVTAVITMTIAEDPQVTAITITPMSIDAGQNLTVTLVFTGGTAPFQYSYTGLPAGCTGQTTATVSCRPRTAGSLTVTGVVTDAWKQSSQLAGTATVDPVPAISSVAVSANPITIGSSVRLSVSVTGGSGVYAYVYTNLPTGCASQNTSSLSCTPTATGSYNVTVQITDSAGLSATGFVAFSVQAASSGGGALGLSGNTGYLLIGAVVAVVVIVAIALLLMRRRKPSAGREPAPAEPAGATWDESESGSAP